MIHILIHRAMDIAMDITTETLAKLDTVVGRPWQTSMVLSFFPKDTAEEAEWTLLGNSFHRVGASKTKL